MFLACFHFSFGYRILTSSKYSSFGTYKFDSATPCEASSGSIYAFRSCCMSHSQPTMVTAIIPPHVLFPSGHLLPLRWLRLPLLILTLALSCVCIAVGGQALQMSNQLEMDLNTEAQLTGTMIMFDMNDIKQTTIVLTTVASLLALTSLVFSLSLSYDWIRHLSRPESTRSREKMDSSEQLATTTRYVPFSTRTLGLQTLVLSFLSVWLFAVLIPSTLFSRTRSAHLTVTDSQVPNLSLNIVTSYWEYGFLRCLAAAPWFSLIFSLPASIVTWVAWKYGSSPI